MPPLDDKRPGFGENPLGCRQHVIHRMTTGRKSNGVVKWSSCEKCNTSCYPEMEHLFRFWLDFNQNLRHGRGIDVAAGDDHTDPPAKG